MIAEAIPREITLEEIPLELIDIGTNVRVDPGELEEMASSIRELGVLQPVRARSMADGRYLLLWGQRRVLASRLAGRTTIPALLEDSEWRDRPIEQLVENLQRADLNPIEEANALREVLAGDRKLTQATLGEKLGRSQAWIANTLGLLKAPEVVRAGIVAGTLTAAHAKAVSGLPPKKAEELAQRAIEDGQSAHDLERDAKWERDRAGDLAKRSKDTEAAAERAIAALRAAEVPGDVPVFISGAWNIDTDRVIKLVKEAGFMLGSGWPFVPDEGCDCRAMRAEIADGKGTKVVPVCISDEHREAANVRRRAASDAREAARKKDEAAISKAFKSALLAQPPHPTVVRLLIRAIDGYSGKVWTEYAKLSDAEALAMLASKTGTRAGEAYGKEVPAKTVLASFGAKAE